MCVCVRACVCVCMCAPVPVCVKEVQKFPLVWKLGASLVHNVVLWITYVTAPMATTCRQVKFLEVFSKLGVVIELMVYFSGIVFRNNLC